MQVTYYHAIDRNTSKNLSPDEINHRFSRRTPDKTQRKVKFIRCDRENWQVTSKKEDKSEELCNIYNINDDYLALRVQTPERNHMNFPTIAIIYIARQKESKKIIEDCLDAKLVRNFTVGR